MAEPAWKTPREESSEPDDELYGVSLLERWVERPDGSMELLSIPLTPEDYLNARFGDKWVQGRAHGDFILKLGSLLLHHFRSQPDVVVMTDVQHKLGPGLPKPCPDLSVVRGVDPGELEDGTFDIPALGVRPCLVIEVISPRDRRIREVDEKDKVRIYERVRIPEYLLIVPPRTNRPEERFQLWGYRLGKEGRYQEIEPHTEGGILSEETGLRFAISPAGDRINVFEASTGRRLRGLDEEAEARQAAEDEVARLRAELERLRGSGG